MPFDVSWVSNYFPDLTSVVPILVGGQKTVFKANDAQHGSIVLKIFNPTHTQIETEREILAVSQISSSRVPQIFDHGAVTTPSGNCLWLREKCIEGQSLRDVLQVAPLSLNDAFLMTEQVLEALCSAEQAHIVHRDVKPDNIMRDISGNFWLIDFGIARHLDLASLTATANLFGKLTLGYAPSEQMRNSKPDIDSRSDLFALGVTIVEAVSGSNPFATSPCSPLEMVKRVETQVPSIHFGNDSRSTALADFASTLIQKRRDLRPRTAAIAMAWLVSIK